MTAPTELEWERLAIRMLHKVCPSRERHDRIVEMVNHRSPGHCPQCGLSPEDYERFIVGEVGKRRQA